MTREATKRVGIVDEICEARRVASYSVDCKLSGPQKRDCKEKNCGALHSDERFAEKQAL